jgi:hypothetical protein
MKIWRNVRKGPKTCDATALKKDTSSNISFHIDVWKNSWLELGKRLTGPSMYLGRAGMLPRDLVEMPPGSTAARHITECERPGVSGHHYERRDHWQVCSPAADGFA